MARREPRFAGRIDVLTADQNVVEDDRTGAAVHDFKRRHAVSFNHCVVDDHVVNQCAARVTLEQADALVLVVVDQIIFDDRILEAVAVDRRPAGCAVVIDNIVGDQEPSHNAIVALAGVTIDMDAAVGVSVNDVSDDLVVAGRIGDVNSVLPDGIGGNVALDQTVTAVARIKPPLAHSVDVVVQDLEVVAFGQTDASASDVPTVIGDSGAFDGDEITVFNVDRVAGGAVGRGDIRPGLKIEDDRRRGRAGGAGHLKTGVGAGFDHDGIPRFNTIGRLLKRREGVGCGSPAVAVAAAGRDKVGSAQQTPLFERFKKLFHLSTTPI